ncbi:hypothetical protein ACFQ21_24570 [Ohtaekwangia kribbensis]|jgi:hypothetical protein|uniref:Uncharacterized protein n=1 Tax=Ohtaekwangia kribbensis TaxID=688913 RepID=A0ABW3KC23_9BACT
MKYIDFTIQSLIMLGGLIFVTGAIFSKSDVFIAILMIQLYLGPWQFTSSLISVIARTPHFPAKLTHLMVSVFYLLSLLATLNIGNGGAPHLALKLYWTIPAWILGIYYYITTWQWTLAKKTGGGKFLTHINF